MKGYEFKARRVMRLLTQRDVALLANISQSILNKWERGIKEPCPKAQEALCAALGLSPS